MGELAYFFYCFNLYIYHIPSQIAGCSVGFITRNGSVNAPYGGLPSLIDDYTKLGSINMYLIYSLAQELHNIQYNDNIYVLQYACVRIYLQYLERTYVFPW